MLTPHDPFAVKLPPPPKSFSKASRSPRQSGGVGGGGHAPRRPATGGPSSARSGATKAGTPRMLLSARSASAGVRRPGQPITSPRVRVDDLPAVTHDEATHAEGGRFVAAAIQEHRNQYLRDGAGFKRDAAAAADHAAQHQKHMQMAASNELPSERTSPNGGGGAADMSGFGDTYVDVGARYRGMTSSPRLPDDALLHGIVRDHLEAKCEAFSAALKLDGDASTDGTPAVSTSPKDGARGHRPVQSVQDCCAVLREQWLDARATAAAKADVYVDRALEGVSPSTDGDPETAQPARRPGPGFGGAAATAKPQSAVQWAYARTVGDADSYGAPTTRHGSVTSSRDPDLSDNSDPGSPLRIAGLDEALSAQLQRSAQDALQQKQAARDQVTPRYRGVRGVTTTGSFASKSPRFTEEGRAARENPAVGQYHPRTASVDRRAPVAIIDRKARQPGGAAGSPPTSPDKATAANKATGVNGSAALPHSQQDRPNGSASSAAAGAAKQPAPAENLESPRQRAKAAAANAAPRPSRPNAVFASKSNPPPPRRSACRDTWYDTFNESALSGQTSPRGLVEIARTVGRAAPIAHRGAAALSSGEGPAVLPNPPPGIAERAAGLPPAPASSVQALSGATSRRAAPVGPDGERLLTDAARANAEVALDEAGARAVLGQGPTGFVDFARQVDRSKASGSKILGEANAGGRAAGAAAATTLDDVDLVDLAKPRPVGMVDFGKQKKRAPLHDVIAYSLTEHFDVPPPQPRHLRRVDFGRMGTHETKPRQSECTTESYDADPAPVQRRPRAATLRRVPAGVRKPVPSDRTDFAHASVYGSIAERAKIQPAAGAPPTTTYTQHVYDESEGADLIPCLNASRSRRTDRAPALDKSGGHVMQKVQLTETRAIDEDNCDPPVRHPRTRGDPMMATQVSRDTRDRRLQPPPIVPLAPEAATVLLGVKKAVALQAERAGRSKAEKYTRTMERVEDDHTPVDLAHMTPRTVEPHDRHAIGLLKKDDVPGPGSYDPR